MDPLDELKTLIDDAQIIIKESRQDTIYKYALEVEKFLSRHNIPVNYYYEEKDFYTYNAYPITSFIDICNAFNVEVKTLIDETANCKPFIYNFIHNAFYKRYELYKMFNIFYPSSNQNFSFATFTAPARLNESINIIYVHPKYILEELLHQSCLIENIEKLDDIRNKIASVFADIERIDGKDLLPNINMNDWKLFNNFSPTQINLLSVLSTLESPIIRCYYDRQLPILITNDVGLSLIEKSLKSITANYERKDSTSKSFFDNRIKNVIFKIDGKQIVKVFPLLDYEIITINNDAIVNVRSGNMKHRINRDQMNRSDAIFDCHSNVALRLAFNEYITYDIVGNSEVAKVKLMLFTYLYKKYGIRDMVITESNVVGTYYPFDIYIKELRVKSIKRNLARIARPS